MNDIKIQQQDFLNSLQYKKNPGKIQDSSLNSLPFI